MASITETISSISSWLRTVTELGVALILVFVVIDVLFPGTTGVVENIGVIVGQFVGELGAQSQPRKSNL